MERRRFLRRLLGVGIGALTACRHEPVDRRPVAPNYRLLRIDLTQLLLQPGDQVLDTAIGLRVRREAIGNVPASFVALSLACTHSGCQVLQQGNGEWLCPCHGSRFGADGSLLTGQATRALDPFPVRIVGSFLEVWRF